MRIALVVLEDFPGSENRVKRQALALTEAGHEVRVFAASGASTSNTWEGVKIHRAKTKRAKAGSLMRRLWEYSFFTIESSLWTARQVFTWGPHVIQYASMPDWLVFCGLPARWGRGTALVLDLHELMPELMAAKGNRGGLRRLLEWLERISVRCADLLLVPTPMCAAILESRIDGSRANVILNAVEPRFFPHLSDHGGGERFTVGFHGTLATRFGMGIVIQAVGLLARENVDVRLIIVGDGDARGDLEALAESLDVTRHVQFLGQRPASEIPAIASAFDIAVVPLLDSEFMRLAYPTKAFEYASMGIPMLCSDLVSTRTMFSEDEVTFVTAGSVSEWAAAIRRSMEQGQRERGAMAERARERTLEEYSWSTWASRYVQLMERAAK